MKNLVLTQNFNIYSIASETDCDRFCVGKNYFITI